MPLKYSQLSPGQRAMVDDGCPIAAMPSAKEQAAYLKWCAANPPVVIPFAQTKVTRNEDADTTAFRAQEDERRRSKTINGLQRRLRKVAERKAIDYSKMRWDPRRSKFVEDTHVSHAGIPTTGVATTRPGPMQMPKVRNSGVDQRPRQSTPRVPGNSALTKDNAEAIARLNGVWKDSYEKLRGTGRIVMTVGNVLKGLVNRGGEVRWR